MREVVIHAEEGKYCGWPANNGSWQWGDELLVGFIRGKYEIGGSAHHHIAPPYEQVFVRSLDGGESWKFEQPKIPPNIKESYKRVVDSVLTKDSIIKVYGKYDHGGERCPARGGFVTSNDKGKTWSELSHFKGLEFYFNSETPNTSRNCRFENLYYFTVKESGRWSFGTDKTFCAEYIDGEFKFKSWVVHDKKRAAMPSVCRSGEKLICAVRRKNHIDCFASDDSASSWQFLSLIGKTGEPNGNPPALLGLPDGRVVAAIGNRSERKMYLKISENQGESWAQTILIKELATEDFGYPRLFLREEGQVVCVYYCADEAHPHQFINSTIINLK